MGNRFLKKEIQLPQPNQQQNDSNAKTYPDDVIVQEKVEMPVAPPQPNPDIPSSPSKQSDKYYIYKQFVLPIVK